MPAALGRWLGAASALMAAPTQNTLAFWTAECCEDQGRQEGEGSYDCEQGASSLIKPHSAALFCPDLCLPSTSDLADSHFLPCHLLVFMAVHFSMFGPLCDHEAINICLTGGFSK